MSAEIEWLPDLISQDNYGDFDEYLRAAYDKFAADFITSTPLLLGHEVRSKRMTAYKGMDHSFWHCIEERVQGDPVSEENRIPKISLVERIVWPRPIIEHVARDERVLAWQEVYRGHGTQKRAHLFLCDEDYVVVLDPRGKDDNGLPRYYFLWTTFLVESDRRHLEMLRRYRKGEPLTH